jgi:hypothetical protein
MTTYYYSTNVPQANQLIKATQYPIESNFLAINDWISVNHVGFNDATNYGKHTFLSLPSQGSNPTTTSNQMAVFCAPSSGANPYEIYYRYPSSGTIVQLSGSGSGSSGGGVANPGYAYLSSTVFIMWGNATGLVTGSNTITFPSGGGFPAFSSTPYQVYFTPSQGISTAYSQAYISSSSTVSFNLQIPVGGSFTSAYWLALGV